MSFGMKPESGPDGVWILRNLFRGLVQAARRQTERFKGGGDVALLGKRVNGPPESRRAFIIVDQLRVVKCPRKNFGRIFREISTNSGRRGENGLTV